MRYTFTSAYSVDECLTLIKNKSISDNEWNWIKGWLGFLGDKGNLYFYKIKDHKFTLQKFRASRNALAPIFYGKIYNEDRMAGTP